MDPANAPTYSRVASLGSHGPWRLGTAHPMAPLPLRKSKAKWPANAQGSAAYAVHLTPISGFTRMCCGRSTCHQRIVPWQHKRGDLQPAIANLQRPRTLSRYDQVADGVPNDCGLAVDAGRMGVA
jgi:hypothetical protein